MARNKAAMDMKNRAIRRRSPETAHYCKKPPKYKEKIKGLGHGHYSERNLEMNITKRSKNFTKLG